MTIETLAETLGALWYEAGAGILLAAMLAVVGLFRAGRRL